MRQTIHLPLTGATTSLVIWLDIKASRSSKSKFKDVCCGDVGSLGVLQKENKRHGMKFLRKIFSLTLLAAEDELTHYEIVYGCSD